LVRSYIYPWKEFTWTAIGGVIDPHESPKQAAIREAKEETGYSIEKISLK
ncbi:NUDIX domain-containing protein, partial [Candidatus Heimdallarchaeota archaeon]